MQNNKYKDRFFELLAKHSNDIAPVGEKMFLFCDYIRKSNKLFNLTAIINIEDMLKKHILDSLSINCFLKGKDILDIGSGAGLPGVPLAILRPELNFLLLDSNNKKIVFLNHVKICLDIKNIDLLHKRMEDLDNAFVFDSVICRSYASLSTIYLNAKKHLKKDGVIVAMKGKLPHRELRDLCKNVNRKVIKLEVPDLLAERHAVIMS